MGRAGQRRGIVRVEIGNMGEDNTQCPCLNEAREVKPKYQERARCDGAMHFSEL